ncbi:MAG: hypothetical protein JXA24_03695 [Proteobacteria bacterium]|nr:hypothetical protein [Pseudomonadota bacterium]
MKKTARDRYEGVIGGVRMEGRERRQTHGLMSAVYSIEKLLRTRSGTALGTAGSVRSLASPHHMVRVSILGDKSLERIAVIAREDDSGHIRRMVAEFAMDFAMTSEIEADRDQARAAELAFLAGTLFSAGRPSEWKSRAALTFDFSSRFFLMSGRPALSAVAGEIALWLGGPAVEKTGNNSHPTAEVVAGAWSQVMISPHVTETQWRIALRRGLNAALVGSIWYQARHLYSASAEATPNKLRAAKDHVRSAWAEAVDVVERGTPFPITKIESKLARAVELMKDSRDRLAVEKLLLKARKISDRDRPKSPEADYPKSQTY